MAIFGIGTDIVEIARIEATVARTGDRLAKHILTPLELQEYQRHPQPARFIAKRFAAKEAASKAMGTGFRRGLQFSHFQIMNDIFGKPHILALDGAAELSALLGVKSWHLSISDERHHAMAFVIIEGDGGALDNDY